MGVIRRVDFQLGEIRAQLDEREETRVVGKGRLGLKKVLQSAERLTQREKVDVLYSFRLQDCVG